MEYQGTANIDFAAVGGTVANVRVVVMTDDAGRATASVTLPQEMWATVIDAPVNSQFLNGHSFEVSLAQGGRLVVEVAIGKGLTFEDGGAPRLDVVLHRVTLLADEPAKGSDTWRFSLTNYRVTYGDLWTTRLIAPGQVGGRTLNRIDFTLGGRLWTLIDDLQGRPGHGIGAGNGRGVLSGTLSTPAVAGETFETVGVVAEDIGRLLSFAQCTWVNWARCILVAADGRVVMQHDRGVAESAYRAGSARIDQGPPQGGGVIRGYLESAYATFVTNRKRLDHAIGVYVEAQVSNALLTRTALLNMLLDALEDDLVPAEPQIDKDLDARVDDPAFFAALHKLLAGLSPNWTEARSKQLRGEIKRYNKKPGFGLAVRKAFESLGIKGFEQLKLGTRHRILHEALIDMNDEQKVPYLLELDYLAFLMIARLLGYEGQFYHPHLGHESRRVAEVVGEVVG